MLNGPLPQAEAARLLTRHHTALYAYVFACVRSHHDAEDILQNVSVVAIGSLDRLTDEAGFLPWAREIARRCTLAHGRKARRERPLDPEVVQQLAEAAEELERERPTSVHQDALLTCLEGLSAEGRRLLVMWYDGSVADADELASRLGHTVQAVYARIKRLKAALRECVERRLAAESSS